MEVSRRKRNFADKRYAGRVRIWDENWADENEEVHGKINTKKNRREHPDGFAWSCCGQREKARKCELEDGWSASSY